MKTLVPLLALAFVACDDDDTSADAATVVIDAGDPDTGTPNIDGDVDATVADADIDASPVPPPDADVDAAPPFGPPASGNNNATLTGVIVGNGTIEVSQLRKELKLEGNLSHAGLVAGPAYATRFDAGSSNTLWGYIRVENQGVARQCFIDTDNFLILDAAGGVLVNDAATLFIGTVGKSQVTTNTCLAPGEVGYLGFIDSASWEQVAGLRFDLTAFATATWAEPATEVRPTQISDVGADFQVRIENQGSVTAVLDFNPKFMLFDDQGLPLHWGFLGLCDTLGPDELAPGESTEKCSLKKNYNGQTDVVHVWVDFFVPVNAAKPAAPDPRVELVRARTRELELRARARR